MAGSDSVLTDFSRRHLRRARARVATAVTPLHCRSEVRVSHSLSKALGSHLDDTEARARATAGGADTAVMGAMGLLALALAAAATFGASGETGEACAATTGTLKLSAKQIARFKRDGVLVGARRARVCARPPGDARRGRVMGDLRSRKKKQVRAPRLHPRSPPSPSLRSPGRAQRRGGRGRARRPA